MSKFKWKPGSRMKGDPKIVGQHLERLRKRYGGMLTAQIVVDDAKIVSSPLHSYFDWDDERAAQKQRITTALTLMGALIQVTVEDVTPSRYYARVVREDNTGDVRVGFISMPEAMSRADTREQVLAAALAELEAFKRKYRALKELAEVFEAIERTRRSKKKKKV